ncbi:hypothetical protein B0O99DRAFT_657713 [Bisporella sp. PMI_857]|nr:hypothetical protein B0O99DRAFT_657713 [Bisporella sp. PMI_857]
MAVLTLYPQSSEMLGQFSLAQDLAQQCFAKEARGRGWHFMENMKDTQRDFALVLRQNYQEEVFRRRLRELWVRLIGAEVAEGGVGGSCGVTVTVQDGATRKVSVIKSFVRQTLNIPFEGRTIKDKWVKIDGIVETDMPKTRVYGAIESPTHGNILWAALDHGTTRIGFALTAERQKAYPESCKATVVAEAAAALKPFSLKFKQRVAKNFLTKDCVFLAGDACHSNSSGAAQWKLSLVPRGFAPPSLLYTYKGYQNADPNEVLGVVMEEASTSTSGLNVAFDFNTISVKGSFESGSWSPGRVFGDPEYTADGMHAVSKAARISRLLSKTTMPISWITIPAKSGPSAFEIPGVMPLRKVFYDQKRTARRRYNVDIKKVSAYVIRLDGWVGTATMLNADAVGELESYFGGILVHPD